LHDENGKSELLITYREWAREKKLEDFWWIHSFFNGIHVWSQQAFPTCC
jgi:hypothetical protein